MVHLPHSTIHTYNDAQVDESNLLATKVNYSYIHQHNRIVLSWAVSLVSCPKTLLWTDRKNPEWSTSDGGHPLLCSSCWTMNGVYFKIENQCIELMGFFLFLFFESRQLLTVCTVDKNWEAAFTFYKTNRLLQYFFQIQFKNKKIQKFNRYQKCFFEMFVYHYLILEENTKI